MNLYEITEKYRQAFADLDQSGLDEQTISDTLEGIEGEFEEKGKSIAAYFQNLEAESDAIRKAIASMAERKHAIDKKVDRLKDYLLMNMIRSGIKKIECPEFSVSVAKNPASVELFDESRIPDQYKVSMTVTTIDKNAIKNSLKCGDIIAGARLVNDKKRLNVK